MREQQGILEQAPTKHKAVLFVNVKVTGGNMPCGDQRLGRMFRDAAIPRV